VDLSVVIVSFNTRDALAHTLGAVASDVAGLAAETIVVDNASADGSAALVAKQFPSVRLIANRDNRLYAAANNQGLALARGRYVLVLNSDATPSPGTLPALVAALDTRPEVGMASCRLVWPDGRTQANCGREWTPGMLIAEHALPGLLWRRLTGRAWHDRAYAGWDRESERDVDVVPGSALCVRREVLQTTGGFDERLRLYFAEDEWCARVRLAGFAIRYLPVGRIVHAEGESTRPVRAMARRLYFDDMVRFTEIRFGRADARVVRALTWPTRLAFSLARWRTPA
jgi:GT2 family glycosyltransferase